MPICNLVATVTASARRVNLQILSWLQVDNSLATQIHLLHAPTAIRSVQESIVGPLRARFPASHAPRSVDSPIAQNAELQGNTGLNLPRNAVASLPFPSTAAAPMYLVASHQHCCALLDHLSVSLSRVC